MTGLSADLVITGGKVVTVNPKDDIAEAVVERTIIGGETVYQTK
jgi:predicted amidohydrolase YtcJ